MALVDDDGPVDSYLYEHSTPALEYARRYAGKKDHMVVVLRIHGDGEIRPSIYGPVSLHRARDFQRTCRERRPADSRIVQVSVCQIRDFGTAFNEVL